MSNLKTNKDVQVHLYNVKDVLRPRGSMEKESLGEYLTEKYEYLYETWTDPKFGDSVSKEEILVRLYQNAIEEVNVSFGLFLKSIPNVDVQKIISMLL
jgi:hypothetical protein